ncbi:unnamed protein product [Clavelina lepadiformis]|uniref:Ubiquitin carboxyl-terminal hydrolase n=1 Tax=Clavelina lepadiformis TaxID=159417 RepID=A0ABP0GFD8_CLALP
MGELTENGVENKEDKLTREKRKISKLAEKSLIKGDLWFLVDSRWYQQWERYTTNHLCLLDSQDKSESLHPGPIDNSSLFDAKASHEIREHLVEDADYKLLPEQAWKILKESYGVIEDQTAIERKVVEKGEYIKKKVIEIYPLKLKLCNYKNKEALVVKKYSVTTTIDELEKDMKHSLNIPKHQDTRVWNAYLDDYEDLSDGAKTLEEYSLQKDQMVVIEEINSDGTWPYDAERTSSPSTSCNGSATLNKTSGSGSYASSSSYRLRNNRQTPGLCGLSNLGNTCFMNSALQCLSNVPVLTSFFKNDDYKRDLNLTNPLGTKGRIATEYAELIKTLWSGDHSSFIPRDFKLAVGQFQSRFLGYQQQDGQELLAFLIDGLHEDLNRISKKPYVEAKDADGRPDNVVASEAWQNHLKRNKSHIVETLHGLFRSTVDCPECPRVSVTFDPFCFLSLPLPVKRERSVECTFVPVDYDEDVVKYKVTVSKSGLIKDVCEALSELVSIRQENMTATDIYNSRFHKIFGESDQIRNIYEKDFIYVFESPADATMLPVYMRYSSPGGSWYLFGQPIMVPVSLHTTTHRDLYKAILRAAFRYFSNEDLKRDVERMLRSDYDDDVMDEKENSQEQEEKEENLYKLFQIKAVNSFGTQEQKVFEDTTEPLKLSANLYLSADWTKEAYDGHFTSQWLGMVKTHESARPGNVKKSPSGVHLRNCMELFTSKEQLGEDNTWYCSSCKKHQQAFKKFDLWMLPPILVIHFKRFSNTRWSRDKLDTFVDFPTRDLDLTDFVVNPAAKKLEKKRRCYNLIAVSNHYGGLGGGHYTAFAKNSVDKKWHYFDDSSVSDSAEERVVTKAAYMLVYQRQDVESWSNEHPDRPFTFMEPMFSPRAMGMIDDVTPFNFNTNQNSQSNEDVLNNNDADDDMDTT